ncbi:MAG: 3-dehydroquinate synthase [Balneolaceae bacterium]
MNADLIVQTPSRDYPVFIREEFPEEVLQNLSNKLNASNAFVIIDENVDRLYHEKFHKKFENAGLTYKKFVLASGETSKSETNWFRMVNFLLENGARRNTPVFVAGGGVTGDSGGFAAATSLRGMPLIHIPTTLLAMVDSSIGGKTGINHPRGKNLIGSFYQPEAVIMDIEFLSTLPAKEWANGLSEVLKYAAIEDPSLFEFVEKNYLKSSLPHAPENLTSLINRCVQIKADIVEKDEKESGIRAYLNFGHTFAHALEKEAGYGKITHGEAVYIGMIAATKLSVQQGAGELDEIHFNRFQPLYTFDKDINHLSVDNLIGRMHSDKKKTSGNLSVVLLRKWGDPYLTEIQDSGPIENAWKFAFSQIKKQDIEKG